MPLSGRTNGNVREQTLTIGNSFHEFDKAKLYKRGVYWNAPERRAIFHPLTCSLFIVVINVNEPNIAFAADILPRKLNSFHQSRTSE